MEQAGVQFVIVYELFPSPHLHVSFTNLEQLLLIVLTSCSTISKRTFAPDGNEADQPNYLYNTSAMSLSRTR